MKERPILFTGEMVRAILDGRKAMTRRRVKEDPAIVHQSMPYRLQRYAGEPYIVGGSFGRTPHSPIHCPYGAAGDRLWVRETFAPSMGGGVAFRANFPNLKTKWTPGIHMPRALSRIDLEITAVRVERLHAITEEDARAEGVTLEPCPHPDCGSGQGTCAADSYRGTFATLWNRINGKRAPWASNPWVWVVSLKRVPS